MTFWQQAPRPESYPNAAIALSELGFAKRGEHESRLRLARLQWTDSFGELMFSTEGLTTELALGYASFAQACRILGLGPQLDFLRGLHVDAVRSIFQQYTTYEDFGKYEVKLLVHRREGKLDLGGITNIARYHVVKRMFSARSSTTIASDHWLFALTLLEQAGWLWANPLLIQDDLLIAALYHDDLSFTVKESNQQYTLGFLLVQSEAGLTPGVTLPVVRIVSEQDVLWIPCGEQELLESLSQDMADLLDGRVSMFGPLPHFRGSDLRELSRRLAAHYTVVLRDTDAAELLMHGGLTKGAAVEAIGDWILQREHTLTGYNLIVQQIREQLPQLRDDPLLVVNRLIKLGLAWWA